LEYVEAHGTGTEIGDPVEANALGQAIGTLRHSPLTVGSVKTNIGHAGGAAGIAGLLKAVLAIENAAIPASLNHETPSIDLDGVGLRVNTALTAWPAGEEPRRAGVSSFGMGGTNAHVIVEQAPAQPPTPGTERENGPTAWVL
jgi:acyl transferase domain-containing protein